MKKKISLMCRDLFGAVLRIGLIFLAMTVLFDAVTRVYYSYMPVSHWIDLRSVQVKEVNGEAVAIIERETTGPMVSVFHRTLFVLYPEITKGCTASLVAVLSGDEDNVITIPLNRVLSDSCPDLLAGRRVEGKLQVSYIFDFPYGVKRTATMFSNLFSLEFKDGVYRVLQTEPTDP